MQKVLYLRLISKMFGLILEVCLEELRDMRELRESEKCNNRGECFLVQCPWHH